MKILQVCSAESIGGGERHVIDLIRALIERGHELHCAIRPHSLLPASLNNSPIHWHRVPLRNALDWFSIRQLRRIITDNQIEIVHAHVARDYPAVGLATKGLSARFFLTRHHFNPLKSSFLYEKTISHITNLIAVSKSVSELLASAFPTLANRIQVIPNWLDERTLYPVDRMEARARFGINKSLAVAMIGQITPLKRQDLFLEAVRLLTTGVNDQQTEFFLIGAAAPEDLPFEYKLKTMLQKFGLSDRVHFTGLIEDLPKYLPAFDVIVAPSENEGFSLVTIEAMAAGCAVIASNVGGMAEIIEHNHTGILSPVGRADALAENLQHLLANNQARWQIGQAAQGIAQERYNRQTIVAQIEELYQRSLPAKK